MPKRYRAIRRSYGWRGQSWEVGDIVEDVGDDEKIPEHFVEIIDGELESKKPEVEPEPTTLSELAAREHPSAHKPKTRRTSRKK
jgi:hypothetical protein